MNTGRAYGRRELIPDLQVIPWRGKKVVIAFDSDGVRNDSVRLAEAKLSECLQKVDCNGICAARIPEDGDAKIGIDDFIVANGAEAFRKLIVEADPVEEPPQPEMMDWAWMIIDEEFVSPQSPTLQWYRDEYYVCRGTH